MDDSERQELHAILLVVVQKRGDVAGQWWGLIAAYRQGMITLEEYDAKLMRLCMRIRARVRPYV